MNKRNSILLFIVFFLFLLLLGYVFGELFGIGYILIPVLFLIAIALIWVSYYKSDSIALAVSRAKPASEEKYKYFHNISEGLAIAAGIPKPRLYVIEDSSMNAFASGRSPEHAVIAVTSGLLEKMNRSELEGVIAHEMSHIKNYDIRFMAVVAVLVGITILISDIILRSFIWGGIGHNRDSGRAGLIIIALGLALAILSPILATLIKFSISRKREFLADSDGALLTRYPAGLISALKKLGSDPNTLKSANQATAHMYISNPFKSKSWRSLFSTHPQIEDRIKALQDIRV